jgi:hypothetical protein
VNTPFPDPIASGGMSATAENGLPEQAVSDTPSATDEAGALGDPPDDSDDEYEPL